LNKNKDRYNHSISVGNKMRAIALEMFPEDKIFSEDMFILGILHDIGYEFSNNPIDHATVGGEMLKRNNYRYWEEVFSHGQSTPKYNSIALDILNTADLLTDKKGNSVTVSERLSDVKFRYGEKSFQYLDFKKLAKKMGYCKQTNI